MSLNEFGKGACMSWGRLLHNTMLWWTLPKEAVQ